MRDGHEPVLRQPAGERDVEARAQVTDEALDLALDLRPIRAAQARSEAPVAGKVGEAAMEAMPARAIGVPIDHHRLDVVVENLPGHATERQEGVLVTRYQRLDPRSEEHTSEIQSLMRISYAVLC